MRQAPGPAEVENGDRIGKAEANHYFQLFASLVATWPLPCREDLIGQASLENQFLHKDPKALDLSTLRSRRREVLSRLTSLVPTCRVQFQDNGAKLCEQQQQISVCPGIPSLVLIDCVNPTSRTFVVRTSTDVDDRNHTGPTAISPAQDLLLQCTVHVRAADRTPEPGSLRIECREGESRDLLALPVRIVEPAGLQLRLTDGAASRPGQDAAGRITVQCSDGVCRYGGRYGERATFTDKPVIYPPIGTWQKLPFFYSDQLVEMEIPPGLTHITFERGFEHRRENVDLTLKSGETVKVERSCKRMADMSAQGWVSGDTHVHWVTNAWNVDEPLKLLAMVQRAEDLKVANNLTLLQRYANQAFVKPSQAPMGPILRYSDNQFHMQMGEEYRNEDLYGHLCLLNIDWLVQPLGTGKIIAGPDSLDYPLNRTAIEACRIQGGISIEAHGTGGNKDVPVNVIHRLSDSLDQMEPDTYYRLLDCGFQLPLTNGSDHPARTLGIARAYVKVQGKFSYDRWVDGIRRGRTFTTSGPLLFLKVNDADIGDVIFPDPEQTLHITAKVISRDPIGTVQIVSNGNVLFSHDTNETQFETAIDIPAKESRWIIVRCSNRKDGRADFGFGNFNAITGPGIAHTSPVYVQVSGVPRFDPRAADFWKERMRIHADDIRTRGRFANDAQHAEAVGYIEQGIEMFEDLKSQVHLARTKSETHAQAGRRLINVIRRFRISGSVSRVLDTLNDSASFAELHDALAPLTLLTASVTSDSRLVLNATMKHITITQGRPERFLVAVENQAGVTGRLHVDAVDPAFERPKAAEWCRVEIVDSPFTSAFLSGAGREYKVVEFTAQKPGRQDIRLSVGVGGNPERRGLSETENLMIDVKPRRRTNIGPVAE